MSNQAFMFDSNIFGNLLENEYQDLTPEKLRNNDGGAKFWITHVQKDEISEAQWQDLTDVLNEFSDEETETSGVVLGISKFGKANFSDGELYQNIKNEMPGKNPMNDAKDALIATTALDNDLRLVTSDQDLQDALEELGKTYMTREDFIRWLDSE